MAPSNLLEISQIGASSLGHPSCLAGAVLFDEFDSVHAARIAFCDDSNNSKLRVPCNSYLLSNTEMENKDLRRHNLLLLIEEAGSIRTLAEKAGTAPNYLSEIKAADRGMGHKVARKLEAAMGKPIGWIDTLHLDKEGHGASVSASSVEQLAEKMGDLTPEELLQLVAKALEIHEKKKAAN